MTTLTIHDEAMRDAVESVIWMCAHLEVWEDGLYHELDRAGCGRLRAEPDPDSEVQATIDMLLRLRNKVQEVRAAELGSLVVVDVPVADLLQALGYCTEVIQEYEGFWEQPVAKRERMLATRDALARLTADLAPVEATA